MEKFITRRDLIVHLLPAILVGTSIPPLAPKSVSAQAFEPREEPWYSNPRNFWETVDPKIEGILETATSNNYSLTDVEDLKIYTPFYLASEIKFEVSWLLLWIIHQEETTVSRDKNPGRSGYFGAMQRDRNLWPDRDAERAIDDMGFLKSLPQRYPTDAREILWAASYIRAISNRIQTKYPDQSDEECQLDSLFEYCAASHAKSRVRKFNQRKSIFIDI